MSILTISSQRHSHRLLVGEDNATQVNLEDDDRVCAFPLISSETLKPTHAMMKNLRVLFFCHTSRRHHAFAAVLALLALCGCATNNKPQPGATGQTGTDTFAAADNDHDGKLSRGEAGDFVVYKVFEVYDSNHDGRLTLVEWTRGEPGRTNDFENRDANRDDVVTLEEAIVYGRRGGGGLSLMRKADKNRDGKLDRAEIQDLGTEL